MSISVYIASPFFNDEEINRVKKMENLLESRNYQVYSPMRDGIMLTPDASIEDRFTVYKDNISHVFDSDLVIAIVSTKDVGTSTEIGVKIGQWETERSIIKQLEMDDPDILNSNDKILLNQVSPRIITFTDNGNPINIMMLGAVIKHCASWDELSEFLDHVDEVGLDKVESDIESIMKSPVY